MALLMGSEWPFHLTPRPSRDFVDGRIGQGAFTGDDNRLLMIHVDGEVDPIGMVAVHELTDFTPTFDIRLTSAWRGRGIGRRVLGLVLDDIFTATDRTRIEGHTRADNTPMRRAFEAAGWVQEAHYRRAWPDADGDAHDAVAYSMLRADWEAGTTTPLPWAGR